MAPGTRCRRTAQRQASTAIWVTDAMLTQALKQYERRCFASCRRLSSHGSALERHRRLGKRHMTDFVPPTPMYRPMWHFEVFGNPTSWTWSPPSTARERREREKEITFRSLFDKLVAWLEDSDLGQPFLKTPDEVAADEAFRDTVVQVEEAETGALLEIDRLRKAFLAQQTADAVAYARMITDYITNIKARFRLEEVTEDELFLLLEPIDLATLRTILPEKAALNLYTAIYTSVVDSVGALVKTQHAASQKLWGVLLERSMKMSSCRVKFRLFRALVQSSRTHKLGISSELLFQTTHSIISELSLKKRFLSKSDHWKQRLILTLRHNVSTKQRLEMYSRAKEALKTNTSSESATLYIRQFWLYVMASDRELPREMFSEFIMEASGPQKALGDRASWHLALARLHSTGTISVSAREPLMRLYHQSQTNPTYHSDYRCWVALTWAVLRQGHATSLQSLRDVMQDLGKPEVLCTSLLWAGLGDSSECAAKAIKMIVKHPRMDERFIWEGCLSPVNGQRGIEQQKLESSNPRVIAQMKLLNQMIGWYLESTHLSERQILRRLEWCVTAQQRLIGQVSAHGTSGLMQTVIADLEKGMNGRSQRIRWIMHLIEKNNGSLEASKVRTAMQRWRSLVSHKWQMDQSRRAYIPTEA